MKSEIVSLTSIRGIAAIWVAIFHFVIPFNREVACISCHLPPLDKAYLSVDLFFILSGFIMCYVYMDKYKQCKEDKRTRNFYISFIQARIARIYPLHLATLIFFSLWILTLYTLIDNYKISERNNIETYIYNLFLIHAWGVWNDVTWNYPSWSISAELFAYLLFPIILSLVGFFLKNSLIPLALVCVVSIEARSWIDFDIGQGAAIYRCISEFTLGIIGYFIYTNNKKTIEILENNIFQFLLLASIILLSFTSIRDSIIIALFLPLILSLSNDKGFLSKILNIKPLYYLGLISYSIYLTHALVMMVYRDFRIYYFKTSGSLGFEVEVFILIMLISTTIFLSWFTYIYIEKKMRVYLNMIFKLDIIKRPLLAKLFKNE
ncbi:acyltransferase family protein [Vibrio ziniensis]|uniref:Acyltransferase n=1 Tax=Vibrio ziniensis TaxID=2711221 RepID=A0A6G7CMF6_9VIBR|nr:acyltransferase [Vibrio ziniensis]QIH43292.1 acyltransferase [Vibrio ziniensis]